MIIIMKPGALQCEIDSVADIMVRAGMDVQINKGVNCTVLGILGDTYTLDKANVGMLEGVERIMSVQEPYKKASRKFHPTDSIVMIDNIAVGGTELAVIAGPCSVESFEQMSEVANGVKQAGASMLRGGAFKPRTSPYSFQGLGEKGLDMLVEAGRNTGLPIVTELMSTEYLDLFIDKVDVIQIGARNMQNYDLLKAVGRTDKPVLLKRGFSSTIEEWLMSAEYIMAGGNSNVILCERGIRTFENFTRNTLDISAIPAVKKISHLPVVVDPSHACGMSWMVEALCMAAVAAGADGLMIEVHNNPGKALCDGSQSLDIEQFGNLMCKLNSLTGVLGKTMKV